MHIQDPIESFFQALWSGPLRAVVGLIGVCLVLMACVATGLEGDVSDTSADDIFMLLTAIPFMFMAWTEYGSVAVLGVVSGVVMWGCLYGFMKSDSGKGWFFALLTSGLVYFGSFALDGKWPILLASYALFALVYWVAPLGIRKIRKRDPVSGA
jgi:hypothetical protein